jgi:hypothetical protein
MRNERDERRPQRMVAARRWLLVAAVSCGLGVIAIVVAAGFSMRTKQIGAIDSTRANSAANERAAGYHGPASVAPLAPTNLATQRTERVPPAVDELGTATSSLAASPAETPNSQAVSADAEAELLRQRRVECAARLAAAGSAEGAVVEARGPMLFYKSPIASGRLAQALAGNGVLDKLATNCAFRTVLFADGKYFSAIWNLPLSLSDKQQIDIIADRELTQERENAARAEAWRRHVEVVNGALNDYEEIRRCAELYRDNAVAFEVCRQGVINRRNASKR